MVIGVPDAEPLAGEPAGLAALAEAPLPVVLLLLLLPLLLQAASVPTASATAPSATAFLENLGCFVLTPGSSFLIAHGSADFPCVVAPRLACGCSLARVIYRWDSKCRMMNAVNCALP